MDKEKSNPGEVEKTRVTEITFVGLVVFQPLTGVQKNNQCTVSQTEF